MVQAASKAPSQPWSRVNVPAWTGNARSEGSSAPALRPVASTVTARRPDNAFAQCSAASIGPTISVCPSDR